ncbi:unnamed protein product [Cercopithifilaria johnstoni]|uniref:Uncharacterized protein n=1 Tax=Cercopithifilaria johnstoni TaxID=2874296 RepID=A0A8J2Q3L4_9BILA|nr:unnamed protein product [Cercopithifilaria johnstoni]
MSQCGDKVTKGVTRGRFIAHHCSWEGLRLGPDRLGGLHPLAGERCKPSWYRTRNSLGVNRPEHKTVSHRWGT